MSTFNQNITGIKRAHVKRLGLKNYNIKDKKDT